MGPPVNFPAKLNRLLTKEERQALVNLIRYNLQDIQNDYQNWFDLGQPEIHAWTVVWEPIWEMVESRSDNFYEFFRKPEAATRTSQRRILPAYRYDTQEDI